MDLTPLALSDLLETFVEGYVSKATANNLPVANTGEGSSLGAVAFGAALMGMFNSNQLQYVAAVARLRNADGSLSSTGTDIDSWFAPFGITRSGATPSSGQVQLSISSATAVFYPVGALLQTLGGGLQFEIVADPINTGYDPVKNGYGSSSGVVSVTVNCLTPGPVGNVPSAAISQVYNGSTAPQILGSPIVTNLSAFTNGAASETNDEFANRGNVLVGAGRGASMYAIYAAAMGVQPGLTVQIGDALTSSGAISAGTITVFVNALGQSSGPSAAIIAAVQTAVLTKKPAGSVIGSPLGPTLITVNASATFKLDGSVAPAAVVAGVQTAFATVADSVGMIGIVEPPASSASTVLAYSDVIQALAAVPGVQRVTNLQLNGGYGDVTAGYGAQIVAGALSASTD